MVLSGLPGRPPLRVVSYIPCMVACDLSEGHLCITGELSVKGMYGKAEGYLKCPGPDSTVCTKCGLVESLRDGCSHAS